MYDATVITYLVILLGTPLLAVFMAFLDASCDIELNYRVRSAIIFKVIFPTVVVSAWYAIWFIYFV